MYDLVIVGAGITSATLCAKLKDRLKIVVLDTRAHLGGNCYDYLSSGTYVHQYGPHIYHDKSPERVAFLGKYTNWVPYAHSVTAEVLLQGQVRQCSFPYSQQAAGELGVALAPEEVISTFFHGYSSKMWGCSWDQLPASVKGRVPKDTKDKPSYFPDQFVGLPDQGYTGMLAKMFDGVEMLLGAPPNLWTEIAARRIVYCGRPDRVPVRGDPAKRVYGNLARGTLGAHWLEYRSLDFTWRLADWGVSTPVLNFCDAANPYTRATHYANLTGGRSRVVGYERPRSAPVTELAPFYPMPTQENHSLHELLRSMIAHDYPELILAGRLGTSRYLDMNAAVGAGLVLAEELEGSLLARY